MYVCIYVHDICMYVRMYKPAKWYMCVWTLIWMYANLLQSDDLGANIEAHPVAAHVHSSRTDASSLCADLSSSWNDTNWLYADTSSLHANASD